MIRLTPEQRVFVTERHLATLTTLRADGTPHVTPVAFTWDPDEGVATSTSTRGSAKVRNILAGQRRAALCQVDGGRWLTLEGEAEVREDPASVAAAEARHARRYRSLSPNPERVVIRLVVDVVLGSAYMTG